MVTTEMVTLSPRVREAGWNLLGALDQNKVDCYGLFLGEFSEGDWRFFLVSERVAREGSIPYWKDVSRVIEFLDKDSKEVLYDVGIATVSPNDLRVRETRQSHGEIEGRNSVRRISLASGESYIYRLR